MTGNRVQRDNQHLSTCIRDNLHILGLCHCLVDVALIEAKTGSGTCTIPDARGLLHLRQSAPGSLCRNSLTGCYAVLCCAPHHFALVSATPHNLCMSAMIFLLAL